jgi:hypothetical protein
LNAAIIDCQEQVHVVEPYLIILNFCRLAMSIRSCFNVIQPFSLIAITYERLRTIVQRNKSLNVNRTHHQQQRKSVHFQYTIIWICLSLFFGMSAGLYQAMTYCLSNTCYNLSSLSSRIAIIIRLSSILSAALISGIIYGKNFLIVKK